MLDVHGFIASHYSQFINYLFLCMFEGRNPLLSFLRTSASKLLNIMPDSQCYNNKSPCLPQLWSTNSQEWTMANNVTTRHQWRSKYLSLSAVIQAAVNLQHIQGLKKSRPGFASDITETSKCIHSSKDFEIQLVHRIQPTPNSHHEDNGV